MDQGPIDEAISTSLAQYICKADCDTNKLINDRDGSDLQEKDMQRNSRCSNGWSKGCRSWEGAGCDGGPR